MPTTESFATFYSLSGTPETGFTTIRDQGGDPFTTSLNDSVDGSSDGLTAVGDQLNWSFNDQTVTLVGFSSSYDEPVILMASGTYILVSNQLFSLSFDATDIGFTTEGGPFAYCFAPGTAIATPAGEAPLETLRIGDPILTADGRTVPVKWIGHQTLSTLFAGHRAQPVCIRAGALGDGQPHRDPTVTADHGLVLDGLVINAGALVNGTTIALVPLADLPARITYYHVETEDHDVILANGAAAETFVDYAGRAAFDNYAEYVALYGHERCLPEMTHPRITSARQLPPAIRARLGLADGTASRSAAA